MVRQACLLILLCVLAAARAEPPGAVPVGPDLTAADLADALRVETNRVRRDYGLAPLQASRALEAAAADQASYMALMQQAGHGNVFRGQATVLDRVLRHGLRPVSVSENVAAKPARSEGTPLSSAALAARLVAAWLDSPGHRANLLDPRATHLGCAAHIARVLGRADYVFGVQVFARLPPESPVAR